MVTTIWIGGEDIDCCKEAFEAVKTNLGFNETFEEFSSVSSHVFDRWYQWEINANLTQQKINEAESVCTNGSSSILIKPGV